MSLKLNLQMFAEDTDGAAVETPIETMSFADMYNNGPQNDEPGNETDLGDDAIVNNDSAEVEVNNENAEDDYVEHDQIHQQKPWKNDQNAQFAAQRRRQEEQQRTAQAVQAARDAVYAEQFKDQVNPYNGKPIRSEADYRAYLQSYNAEVLKNSGIQQEQFNQIVNADPRIQYAQQIIKQQELMNRQNQQAQEAKKLDEAVEKIKKFDKSVKTQQDIIDNPHFQEIAAMYNRGYSLEDAYYLANRAEMDQKKQAAARQQAINQVTSKQHMKATGQQGAGDEIVVPADVMVAYRRMNPKATEAEIKKHYARMQK